MNITKHQLINTTLFILLIVLTFVAVFSKDIFRNLYFVKNPDVTHEDIGLQDRPLEKHDAKIVQVTNEPETSLQTIELQITSSSSTVENDKTIEVLHQIDTTVYSRSYEVGDKVIITSSLNPDGSYQYFISGYNRRGSLALLILLFAAITIFVSRQQGFRSLLGLCYSFLIIFNFTLPFIYRGFNPFLVAIASAAIIVPITFYFTHGFNKKTTIAVIGTLISLCITGILALYFIHITQLNGFASEEAGLISTLGSGTQGINVQQLIIAGIIIGALGILDDVTISQSAIVAELKDSAKKITSKELYKRAMNVGKDHIASVVNTLILVYTGGALPTLLLLIDVNESIGDIANFEFVAEELVKMVVPSIGLILAVPITTVIAVIVFNRNSIQLKS